jgi:hypothetical protein
MVRRRIPVAAVFMLGAGLALVSATLLLRFNQTLSD